MLDFISKKRNVRSFSICPENFTGEKGGGGRAVEGTGASCAKELGVGWKISPSVDVPAKSSLTLADVKGSGAIKHIWITGTLNAVRGIIIRIYWDGNEAPSVEAPLGDFFANASYDEYRQLSSLAVCCNPKEGLNCYWTMPYRKGFKITLENLTDEDARTYYQIDCEERAVEDDELYFHAQFRRSNPLEYKKVHTLLDGIRGKGQYVGTYLYWGVNNNGWWGEGEIKFYLDGDDEYPTICGTGTEDYFCGSHNFDVDGAYREFSTPYSGLYKIDATDGTYKSNRRFGMYRWHISDPIYFDTDIRVTIQALGWRKNSMYKPLCDDISSVSYWYSDTLSDVYPQLPDYEFLEII